MHGFRKRKPLRGRSSTMQLDNLVPLPGTTYTGEKVMDVSQPSNIVD